MTKKILKVFLLLCIIADVNDLIASASLTSQELIESQKKKQADLAAVKNNIVNFYNSDNFESHNYRNPDIKKISKIIPRIPKALWQDHIAPYLDVSHELFPIALSPACKTFPGNFLAASPDSSLIAVESGNPEFDKITIYDTKTENEKYILKNGDFGHNLNSFVWITFNQDSSRILVKDHERVNIYDIRSQPGILLPLLGEHGVQPNDYAFSPDRQWMINNNILYHVQSGIKQFEFKGVYPRFSSDSKFIQTMDPITEKINRYEIATGTLIADYKYEFDKFERNAGYGWYSPDKRYWVTKYRAKNHEKRIKICAVEEEENLETDLKLQFIKSVPGYGFSFSDDSKRILVNSEGWFEGERSWLDFVYDLASGEIISITKKDEADPTWMVYDPVNYKRLFRVKGNWARFTSDYSSYLTHFEKNVLVYDLGFLKTDSLQRYLHGQLSAEQLAFICMLNKWRETHEGRKIYLNELVQANDVFSKKEDQPTLEEMRSVLHTFHPAVTASIIKQYKILDASQEQADHISKVNRHARMARLKKYLLYSAAAITYGVCYFTWVKWLFSK